LNYGRIVLVVSGWIRKSKNALAVTAKVVVGMWILRIQS